jgi:hypothetical protein
MPLVGKKIDMMAQAFRKLLTLCHYLCNLHFANTTHYLNLLPLCAKLGALASVTAHSPSPGYNLSE